MSDSAQEPKRLAPHAIDGPIVIAQHSLEPSGT